MLFSVVHGKTRPFCILISRCPHMLRLLPSWHVEKVNHACLQYVTAQLCRGALNLYLLEMKRTRLWRDLLPQTTFWLFRFLGHKYLSVCLHIYHLCGTIVHAPAQLLPFFVRWLLCHPHLTKSVSLYSEEGGTWEFWLVTTFLPSAIIVVFFYYILFIFVYCFVLLYTVNQMSESCGCLTVVTECWF